MSSWLSIKAHSPPDAPTGIYSILEWLMLLQWGVMGDIGMRLEWGVVLNCRLNGEPNGTGLDLVMTEIWELSVDRRSAVASGSCSLSRQSVHWESVSDGFCDTEPRLFFSIDSNYDFSLSSVVGPLLFDRPSFRFSSSCRLANQTNAHCCFSDNIY